MEMHSVFLTLADPTRFRIVELLRHGEQSVSDLVQQSDVHQSGVSRHLGILLELGFVQVRRDGQHRRYSLRPDPFREMEAWALAYRGIWNTRLDRLESALRKKKHAHSKKNKEGDSR